MYTRDRTKVIKVGGVAIGGGNPIAIQSMTNTDTRDVMATVKQIEALVNEGCEVVRVAVPDLVAAGAIKGIKEELKRTTPIPIVADIHFDYKLALAAIESGADKLRINPGNIGGGSIRGGRDRVRQVAEAAKAAGIPIRVGANGGSLERGILEKYGGVTAESLCESVIGHVRMLEDNDFFDIAVAIKASDISVTLEAHKLLCKQIDYPVHIGITEAGSLYKGTIKSAAGIGALLAMGVGDTVRVSLTGDPVEEVRVAKGILQAFGLRWFGPEIVSCPTCGRCEMDLAGIAKKVEDFCDTLDSRITVAVMGCVVNGPGEAREADFGIACGKGHGVIFRKGQIIRKVDEMRLAEELIEAIIANELTK